MGQSKGSITMRTLFWAPLIVGLTAAATLPVDDIEKEDWNYDEVTPANQDGEESRNILILQKNIEKIDDDNLENSTVENIMGKEDNVAGKRKREIKITGGKNEDDSVNNSTVIIETMENTTGKVDNGSGKQKREVKPNPDDQESKDNLEIKDNIEDNESQEGPKKLSQIDEDNGGRKQ